MGVVRNESALKSRTQQNSYYIQTFIRRNEQAANMKTKGRNASSPSSRREKLRRTGSTPISAAARVETSRSVPIVGVGASAGGLEAFTELLRHIPADTGMAFVFVQHLDPQHENALVSLLARVTTMPVREVTDGLSVEANVVHVIPRNKLMNIAGGTLRLKARKTGRTPPHSIDLFLESLALDQRERAIGVILSGAATDGTLGLEAIKGEGGITFAQDASAKYDSMPRSAIGAGCVDFELPPKAIAGELVRIAAHPFVAGSPIPRVRGSAAGRKRAPGASADWLQRPSPAGQPVRAATSPDLANGQVDDGFKKILLLVRNHSGVDFLLYKPATVQRRVARRMVLSRFHAMGDYAGYLRGNTPELEALYSDLLIGVTSFFRNPEIFELLRRKIFPELLAEPGDTPIRIWSMGCSTGQEAYSLAMAFAEAAGEKPRARKLQIFATDLNELSLNKARAGLYAKQVVHDISPGRLRRFFVEEDGGYRASKDLRQNIVFARQNVLTDPPFSRMDLVSCRNLLIYIEPDLQKRILPMFHYALNPEGILLLGASESVAGFTELFKPLDKKHKIFVKRPATIASHLHSTTRHLTAVKIKDSASVSKGPATSAPVASAVTAQREADRLLVAQFAPPSVLINGELQVIQFRGTTSPYFEPPTGKASFDVLKMARAGLMLPLRAAINKARKEGKRVSREHVRVGQDDGSTRVVTIQVAPLKNVPERGFLILITDEHPGTGAGLPEHRVLAPSPSASAPGRTAKNEESRRNLALQDEVIQLRDFVQSIQDQNESASEGLQASNEEVTSANEELQSINEELETSKEELESTNEELVTVNEEMANRNTELNRLNGDLSNLQVSIHTAILVVTRDLIIRRFTPLAEKAFNLLATDVGRPLGEVRHLLSLQKTGSAPPVDIPARDRTPLDLSEFAQEVIDSARVRECEVRDRDGRWYLLRVRPYLSIDNKIDGAVFVLMEITDLKRAERDVQVARDYAEATLRTIPEPLVVLRVNTANEAFYQKFKTTRAEIEGHSLWEIGGGEWNIPRLRQLLEDVLPRKSFFNEFEVEYHSPRLGHRTMLLNARRFDWEPGIAELILLGIEDITERQRLDDSIRRSEERFRALTAASSQIVWTANAEGLIEEDSLSWRAFTGQTFEQCRGWGWLDAIHPEDREPAKKIWRESVAERRIAHIEYRLHRVDGEYRWTSMQAVPVFNLDGMVREWIGTNTDITERKETNQHLRASEIRFRRLFEAAHDGVLLVDPVTRRITEANPFILELLGYSRAELIGKELFEVGLLKDQAASRDAFLRLREQGFIRYEDLPLETKAGERRDVEMVSNLYAEDGEQIIQCNIRDITERKRMEAIDLVQKSAFEKTIRGAPLTEVLELLVRTARDHFGHETRTAIFTVDAAHACLRFGATAGMDESYMQAVDGFKIDPKNPSCGTVAYTGEALIVDDVANDPLWKPFRQLALQHEIYACWSFPISSPGGEVLGTFAIYHRRPKPAKAADVHIIRLFARAAAILIERHRSEAALRESEKRYRGLFDSIDDGFCIIEMIFDGDNHPVDYRFLEVNPSFERQSGLTNVVGKRIREFAPDFESHWFEAFGRVAVTGKPVRFVNEAKALGRWFDVYGFPLGGEASRKVAILFSDTTEQRERALELERVRDEAVAASRAKDEFLAALSHELRTPLNPALLLASDGAANPDLPEDVRRYFETIRKNISLEARLIDDLLDLTRIARGKLKLELQPCNVEEILRDAITVVRPDIAEKSIRFSEVLAPARVIVMGDPVRLQQIFWNVLRNAVHFTPQDGEIAVEARVESDGGELLVSITDTGIGISPDDLERIFETFSQGEVIGSGATRKFGGLGLGLAISRKLVEMQGGTIHATSPGRGNGSTFTIKLPLLKRDVATPLPAFSRPANAPRRADGKTFRSNGTGERGRILIVDDHAPTRITLQTLLERRNFEVVSARSVAEALALIRQREIDFVISDIGLPDGDGYSLMRQIRAAHPNVQGVALSGYGAESDIEKSRAAGFIGHLIKPISIESLNDALEKLSRRSSP
jgi:two-component system, chemotaxis family, CheB/CheR fusion protein